MIETENGGEIYRKGEEGRARLKEKALMIAHVIVRKIELTQKIQLSRDEFDFVIDKTRDAAKEGYMIAFEGFFYITKFLK